MNANYYLYDQVLLGQKKTCGKELFTAGAYGKKEITPQDEQVVLDLVRYFIEYYMGWSPEDAMESLTPELLAQFHLDTIVKQRLSYPLELSPLHDMEYLVARCYPKRYRYDEKKAVENYYDNVLSGKVKRFQKGFFSQKNGKGEERAYICFRKMLSMIGPFRSTRDMYDFFSRTEGRKALAKYKLESVSRDFFEFPIDYLHYSLPEDQRDEFYYNKLRFQQINNKQKRRLAKQGKFIA